MSIILTRNFDGYPVTDFSAEVRKRAAAASRTGVYDFIYIVPTRRRVRELQRELVTDVAFGKLPVFTLELFAHEIFLLLTTGRRIISPSMQGMVVGRVLSEGEFKFFRYKSFRPGARKGVAPIGTIKKIVDQIGYLEENGITPEDYGTMAAVAEESEKLKLAEFHRIYSGYLKNLGEKFVDSSGILSIVNAGLSESREFVDVRFPGRLTVFVEGFYNFKKPELEFLRLISSEKRFSFLVKLDCDKSNENLFRTMIATSEDLAQRGFKIQASENGRKAAGGSSPQEFLASYLFADNPPDKKLNLKNQVYISSVRDNLREAEFVAEKIKEIVRKNPGQKLDRICVASYLPQNYSQLFREVFQKYRVPANITDRYTLESNNVVNAILSFIDIKAADYERVTLLRAITNGTLKLSDEFGRNAAAGIIYNAARMCRFERGLKTFRDSIDSRIEFLERLGASDTDNGPEQTARDIQTLRNAKSILISIELKLAGFDSEMSPEEFKSCLTTLVGSLGIHENIVRVDAGGISTEIVERDSRALSAFFEVVDEVVEVETERGTGRLPLTIWLESLRSALSLTRYNIRQKYGYGVYVTSLEEIRGLEFDCLFIVGLNEGELPAKYDPEIFLPIKKQEENRETEPYLQRHLFYQAVSSFRKELYLIYPVQRDEVRLVKSSFVDTMASVVEFTALEDVSSDSGVRNIYNIHQLIESGSGVIGAREKIAADATAVRMLPPNLGRCIAAEAARYRADIDSEFVGKITDSRLAAAVDGLLGRNVFSAAQLESLARCGFQYFAGRILGVAEVPDIETTLTPIERGAVLHKILYRFYSELSKEKKLGSAKKETCMLLSIAREVLDNLGVGANASFGNDLFEIERETILGTRDVPGTLQLFLEKVQATLSGYGFVPQRFEVGFGMKGGDGNMESGPVDIGGISLRGKIDRMDSNENGLAIFDYKTSGRNPTHQDVIRDRISPQLAVYLNALTGMQTTASSGKRVVGAAFISINRERLLRSEDGSDLVEFIVRDEGGELLFNKKYRSESMTRSSADYPKTMDELLTQTESFVKEKVDSARSGRFNLTKFSPQRVCVYCPYIEACRIALTGEGAEAREAV